MVFGLEKGAAYICREVDTAHKFGFFTKSSGRF